MNGLAEVEYPNQYPKLAGIEFPDKINIQGTGPFDIINAGAVLEDAEWRFLHHFLDPSKSPQRGLVVALTLEFLNSLEWASTILQDPSKWGSKSNDYALEAALNYYEDSITHPQASMRRQNQMELLRSLGHIVHLLEDAAQPSHTRGDSHSGAGRKTRNFIESAGPFSTPINENSFDGESQLELYGSRRLRVGVSIDPFVSSAMNATEPTYFSAFADYFNSMASFSNAEFFSDDTILDDEFTSPSISTVSVTQEQVNGVNQKFLVSLSQNLRLARETSGLCRLLSVSEFCRRMSYTLESESDVVLRDNALGLVPQAVSHAAGFLDFFFRGRITARFDDQSNLIVKNVSDPSFASSPSDLIFLDGVWEVYYEAANRLTVVRLPQSPLATPGSIDVGEETSFGSDVFSSLQTLSSSELPDDVRFGGRVILIFRGMIGQEEAVASTSFGLSQIYLAGQDSDYGAKAFKLVSNGLQVVHSLANLEIAAVTASNNGDVFTAARDASSTKKIFKNGVLFFDFSSYFSGNELNDIDLDSDGNVYFIESEYGAYRIDNNGANFSEIFSRSGSESVQGASADNMGNQYVATSRYEQSPPYGSVSEVYKNQISITNLDGFYANDIDANPNGEGFVIAGGGPTSAEVLVGDALGEIREVASYSNDYCRKSLESFDEIPGEFLGSAASATGASIDQFGAIYWVVRCSANSSTGPYPEGTHYHWEWSDIFLNGNMIYRTDRFKVVNGMLVSFGPLSITDIDVSINVTPP